MLLTQALFSLSTTARTYNASIADPSAKAIEITE